MPTIIIAVTPNSYDPISPDWCRYVQSGVYRFTAGDHLFTMIFSELEVTRETTWQLVKQIQANVKQQDDLQEGLEAFCEDHGDAEWDRKHRMLTIKVRP